MLILSAVALPLSGCFLPPIVSLAALVFDAGSFVTTGKTAKDHGISLIAQEDCALLRLFDGPVCRPYSELEESPGLAVLTPLDLQDEGVAALSVKQEQEEAREWRSQNILATLDYASAGLEGTAEQAPVLSFGYGAEQERLRARQSASRSD